MKINTKNNYKTFSLFNLLMVIYFQSRESSTGSDTAYTNWIWGQYNSLYNCIQCLHFVYNCKSQENCRNGFSEQHAQRRRRRAPKSIKKNQTHRRKKWTLVYGNSRGNLHTLYIPLGSMLYIRKLVKKDRSTRTKLARSFNLDHCMVRHKDLSI